MLGVAVEKSMQRVRREGVREVLGPAPSRAVRMKALSAIA